MTNPSAVPGELSEIFELSVLETLQATLRLTTRTLIDVYPFPDEEVISHGEYTPLHAYSRALINQIQALEDTIRCYRRCLEFAHSQPWDDEPDEGGIVPF
jgi:hypothetical protein